MLKHVSLWLLVCDFTSTILLCLNVKNQQEAMRSVCHLAAPPCCWPGWSSSSGRCKHSWPRWGRTQAWRRTESQCCRHARWSGCKRTAASTRPASCPATDVERWDGPSAAEPPGGGAEAADHLGVNGGVDPGQPPAQVVQLLCKHLLAFLKLLQDVWSLKDTKHSPAVDLDSVWVFCLSYSFMLQCFYVLLSIMKKNQRCFWTVHCTVEEGAETGSDTCAHEPVTEQSTNVTDSLWQGIVWSSPRCPSAQRRIHGRRLTPPPSGRRHKHACLSLSEPTEDQRQRCVIHARIDLTFCCRSQQTQRCDVWGDRNIQQSHMIRFLWEAVWALQVSVNGLIFKHILKNDSSKNVMFAIITLSHTDAMPSGGGVWTVDPPIRWPPTQSDVNCTTRNKRSDFNCTTRNKRSDVSCTTRSQGSVSQRKADEEADSSAAW